MHTSAAAKNRLPPLQAVRVAGPAPESPLVSPRGGGSLEAGPSTPAPWLGVTLAGPPRESDGDGLSPFAAAAGAGQQHAEQTGADKMSHLGSPRSSISRIASRSSRLLRSAVESAPAVAASAGATLRALLLVTLAPMAVAVVQMIIPYNETASHIPRVAAFAACVALGSVPNSMSQFQLYAQCDWRHIAFTWPLIGFGFGIGIFVAANAAVDLSRVPFCYAAVGVVNIIITGQVNSRFHAFRLRRLAARVQAEDGLADAKSLQEALRSPGTPAPPPPAPAPRPRRPRRRSRRPGDKNFYFRRLAVVSLVIYMMPVLYLFVFSAVSTASAQIAINIVTSVLSYLLMAVQLRYIGRKIYQALPNGDALTIFILQSLTRLRVFRQLCYFRVRSLEVFAVSLVLELLAVTFPASLLADRFGRPVLRQFKFLARRLRDRGATAPAPARAAGLSSGPGPRTLRVTPPAPPGETPSSSSAELEGGAGAGSSTFRVRWRGDLEDERPAARASPFLSGPTLAGGGCATEGPAPPTSTSVSSFVLAGPAHLDDDDDGDREDTESEAGVALHAFQTGVRSMLVLNAIACWVGCATFAVGICVARWGPAHTSFPFSPVTFDEGSFAAAMATTGISAAAHAGLLLVFQVVSWIVPDLKEKLGLASSWGVLRRHWLTIAMMFCASTTIPFLTLYRYSNIYSYVFPDAYEVLA
eukprot:tig00020704_g13175.t1